MVKIDKEKFFYAIIAIIAIDLIIDGFDDFGTRLYLIHMIRSIIIVGIALILSINFKRKKKKFQ